jgi:hypothetical protein
VQPTDLGLVGFRGSEESHEDREEDERGSREHSEGFLAMRFRIFRLAVTISAIAATALAGGATLKAF